MTCLTCRTVARFSLKAGVVFWLSAAVLASIAQGQSGAGAMQAAEAMQPKISGLTRFPHGVSQRARSELDRGRVADTLPMGHILLMLRRSSQQEQALAQFMAEQYNPKSPNFHRWLTSEEFGERFGPTTEEIATIKRWLTQQGFTINNVPAGRLFIDFSGTAGQVTKAFHTEIHRYHEAGKDRFANATDPYFPTALAGMVSGFRGLNDFHPQPLVRHLGIAHFDRASHRWSRPREEPEGGQSSAQLTEGLGSNSIYLVGPQDFAQIYGINRVWAESAGSTPATNLLVGTGQTIGVVGESDLDSADIQNFRDEFGVTALGPHGSVNVDHPPSSVCAAPDPSDNEPESYLDAEWAGAMAPDATIDFVTCGQQGATSGADLAAAYIVQDPAHAQQVSVLSTSYGDCEAIPDSEANQFYTTLWQQAAAEGITVVAAAGDTGGDACQTVSSYADDGLSVDNEASTPYDIAAGGTDFSDVFSGTAKNYWSQANGANLQSAKSYIPEMAWNESCASPMVLQHFAGGFEGGSGPNGFCIYAAQQPVNPNTAFSPFFLPFAGSGGLSVVSARPSWQTGVPGIPAGGGRALPDIAMFASGGYAWGQTLVLCDSALAGLPAGTACDFSIPGDAYANAGGGTSFVAPAFAGIMALIDQKSGSRQGQADNVLYPLAAQQYAVADSAQEPSLSSCAAYLGAGVLDSCYFHDISATPNPSPDTQEQTPFLIGNTAVPCTGTATAAGVYTDASTGRASNSENCYGYQITVAPTGRSLSTTPDYYGELSTADNSTSPAFAAAPGYDLATGLGSPNVYALVNAPEWSLGGAASSVRLPSGNFAVAPGKKLTLEAIVSSAGGPVESGAVSFYSGEKLLGTVALGCGQLGEARLQLSSSAFGGPGEYGAVFAYYSGGVERCHARAIAYYGARSATAVVRVKRLQPLAAGSMRKTGR